MKIGSLFDGSGGFPLAASLCGIAPAFASEVEPYPIAVTTSRFPNMKHLGDISKINGSEIEPVHIITFGSPCQDLSVAGKQKGLKHEANGDDETTRSGLFMEAVRIIKEMREATNGEYPRYAVWENVPGAFGSNKSRDFQIVLEEIIKITEPAAPEVPMPEKGRWPYADILMGDGWSIAYRTLDAQYWGVPQRRRRIYLVADFGGRSAGEILFKREGLRGYFEEGRTPWEGIAARLANRAGADHQEREGSRSASESGIASTLYASYGTKWNGNAGAYNGENFVLEPDIVAVATQQGGAEINENGICPTITAAAGMSGNNQPYVAGTVIVDNIGGQAEYGKMSEVNGTLRAGGQGAVSFIVQGSPQDHKHGGIIAIEGNGSRPSHQGDGYIESDVMYTLNTIDRHAVCYGISSYHSNGMMSDNPHSGIYEADKARTLDLNGGNPACNQGGIAVVEHHTWNGDKVAPTLTANNAGGSQRMPDKDNFNCVIRESYVYDARGNGDGKTAPVITGDHNNRVTDYTAVVCTMENFMGIGEDVSPTLKQRDHKDPHAVAYGIDRAAFNQGKNALFSFTVSRELQPTLTTKGPGAVAHTENKKPDKVKYVVRRLTPTECARLQGFPDTWGHPIRKKSFTDEEYAFWLNVRNTHADINGKTVKHYTKKQMLAWYNKLHSDGAEYKMWGNGIALPTALYVLQGIAEQLRREENTHKEPIKNP